MAITLSTTSTASLRIQNSSQLSLFVQSSPSPSSSSRLSSSSSLQFHPVGNGTQRISTYAPSRRQILPVAIFDTSVVSLMCSFNVAASKQTFSSFDDLLEKADKPVLVDFYATWCGPCQFMVPVLNEVSNILKDKIMVVKIDTEKYQSIADKYSIQALPTFIIFKDGKPHDRFEGALTADQLVQRIEGSLQVKQ
ncbi:hypothetical protein ACFE04_025427 [Oxalis oulophora]